MIRSVPKEQWRESTGGWPNLDASFLYIIQNEEGPIKVGVTKNVFWRRSELQCGNHRRLHIRAVYEFMQRKLALNMERHILDHFYRHRLLGEWLDVSFQDAIRLIEGRE